MVAGLERERFQEPTERVRLLAGPERFGLCGWFSEVSRHQHAAPAVVIGIDGPLRFVAGRTHESRAALLAPGFSHAVGLSGRLAMFLLPPHALSAGATLPVRDLPHPERWVELGQAVLRGELRDLAPVDDALARERLNLRPVDDRLRAALAQVSGRLEENLPVEAVAADARLSASRLMALSREQLGTSLRGYRRWLRTLRVARAYAAGGSLTEAALEAGFSSSAHLSMATREHFGIRPSDVLSPHNRAGIVTLGAASVAPVQQAQPGLLRGR
jgi:AraC-like DNA-binding protein